MKDQVEKDADQVEEKTVIDDEDDDDGMDALTEEERELLGLDEEEAAEADAGDGEGDAEDDATAEEAAEGAPDGAEEAAGKADAAGDDIDAAGDEEPTVIPEIDDIQAKIDGLKAEDDNLWDRFNDGEIDDAEMRKSLRSLSDKRADLGVEMAERERERNAWATAWKKNIDAYKADYPDLWGDDHVDEFDAIVRAVTGSRDPKVQALSMRKKLELGHDTYAARAEAIGKAVPARTKGGAAPAAEAAKAPAEGAKAAKGTAKVANLPPKGQKAEPPVTVRNIPQSDIASAADGKYAALDRLMDEGNSDAFEAALARLSPEERDAYGAA